MNKKTLSVPDKFNDGHKNKHNEKHNNKRDKKKRENQNSKDLKTAKNTYPISVHNQQCVGPCYYSNTKIIHPLTLDEIKNVNHNFCPVGTFVFTDPQTKKTILSNVDRCVIPTARETQMDDILRDNVISPQFYFSSDYFVRVYYKINTLEDLLNWLDHHKNNPFKTKERLFNNSMVVYGNQLNIIDHRLIQFINELMSENMSKLYRGLVHFFLIKGNDITLVDNYDNDVQTISTKVILNYDDDDMDIISDEQKNSTKHKNIALIRSYIKDKFLGSDNIHQFMSKIIRYYKEDLTDRYISELLVNYMIEYIIKRIKLTLSANDEK